MTRKVWFRPTAQAGLVLLLLAAIVLLREVLLPLFIALGAAYVFDPLIDRFERWKIPRTWGILLLTLLIALALTGILLYVVPRLAQQLEELQTRLPGYWNRASTSLLPRLESFRQQHALEFDQGLAWLIEQAKSHGGALLAGVSAGLAASFRSLGSLLAKLVGLVIIPVMTFYLLRDFDELKAKATELIPPRRREWVVNFFGELDAALSSFIKGQITVALILSLIYSTGLFLFGCPAPLLIGLVAGFANLIPYLGLALGLLPAVLLTYLSGNGLAFTLGAGATFVVGQMLEGMVITPRIVGKSVGLHPVVVMVALMVGGTYFGFAGMILALPTTAVLVVVFRRLHAAYVKSVVFHEDSEQSAPQSGQILP